MHTIHIIMMPISLHGSFQTESAESSLDLSNQVYARHAQHAIGVGIHPISHGNSNAVAGSKECRLAIAIALGLGGRYLRYTLGRTVFTVYARTDRIYGSTPHGNCPFRISQQI